MIIRLDTEDVRHLNRNSSVGSDEFHFMLLPSQTGTHCYSFWPAVRPTSQERKHHTARFASPYLHPCMMSTFFSILLVGYCIYSKTKIYTLLFNRITELI